MQIKLIFIWMVSHGLVLKMRQRATRKSCGLFNKCSAKIIFRTSTTSLKSLLDLTIVTLKLAILGVVVVSYKWLSFIKKIKITWPANKIHGPQDWSDENEPDVAKKPFIPSFPTHNQEIPLLLSELDKKFELASLKNSRAIFLKCVTGSQAKLYPASREWRMYKKLVVCLAIYFHNDSSGSRSQVLFTNENQPSLSIHKRCKLSI